MQVSTVTFTATPLNGGTTPTYQWKVNGTNVGTNSNIFSTSTLTNGQAVTCTMTSNASCTTTPTANSNSISMTVNPIINPTVSISQTTGTNPQCTGASSTFTATVSNGSGTSYFWKVDGTAVGANSTTYTTTSLTNGQAVTCDIVSTAACSNSNSVILGTAIGTNSTSSGLGAAYPSYYGAGRQQYIVLASELSSLGFYAGDITSLGFDVAGTTGNPSTLNGYTIKIATTASSAMTTTFLNPTFSTVFGPVNYTPTLNAINTHTFVSPFNWDGLSNILIDICFYNGVTGVTAYQTYQTSTTFVSTAYYQKDGTTGSGACTIGTATYTGSIRPNMIFSQLASPVNASSNSIVMNVSSALPASVAISLTSGTNPQCSGAAATFHGCADKWRNHSFISMASKRYKCWHQ